MSTSRMRFIFTFWALAAIMISCNSNPYVQGQRVYNQYCSNCHMEDGSGLSKLIPSLQDQISTKPIAYQVCLINNGFNADSLGNAMNVMPSFADLKDVELANLINYINYRWNDSFKESTVNDIIKSRKNCSVLQQ